MSKKINRNSVSLAGEFAVLSQLALRGYDANMTLGNTKRVDILVSNPDTGSMYRLEVKTNLRKSRKKPSNSKLFGRILSDWLMNKKHETISESNLFYCFVNIEEDTNLFKFYVVPSKVVAKYVKDEHRFWLNADGRHKDSLMRQFRIGLEGEKYPIPTPKAKKYENNWNFNKSCRVADNMGVNLI